MNAQPQINPQNHTEPGAMVPAFTDISTQESAAIRLVDSAEIPAFILNLDSHLSLFHGNQGFYQLLDTQTEEFPTLYENKFCNVLTFHHQFKQLRNIRETLKNKADYRADVEILTASGQVKSMYFQVQRQTIGDLGSKLVGFFLTFQEHIHLQSLLTPVDSQLTDDFPLLAPV